VEQRTTEHERYHQVTIDILSRIESLIDRNQELVAELNNSNAYISELMSDLVITVYGFTVVFVLSSVVIAYLIAKR